MLFVEDLEKTRLDVMNSTIHTTREVVEDLNRICDRDEEELLEDASNRESIIATIEELQKLIEAMVTLEDHIRYLGEKTGYLEENVGGE